MNGSTTNCTQYFAWPLGSIHTSACIINVLFGLPTHSYVMWLIITGTGSGVASEIFNLNLFVCEISFCLNSLLKLLPFVSQSLMTITQWLVALGLTGRPLFQCLICVERYLAVVHPVIFLKFKPLRYRVICCSAAWICILGSCLFCMFTLGSNYYTAFTCFLSMQLLLFFSIQLFCLVAVLRALKQSGPGERRRERVEKNHMKRRAFHLILITTVSIVIIFVPLILLGFLSISQNYNEIHRTFGFAGFILTGFVQPFLYLHQVGKLPCQSLSCYC